MTEQQMMEQVDAFIKENKENIVRDIAALVAQRSVETLDEAAPGAPFGPGPRRALDIALDIARDMGMETCDGDGYVGWAELPGREKGYLATITHVDVVPEGDGWNGEPFRLEEKEGWLIGRGVADDKGPSVLCLYAAKFFLQQGAPQRYGLRVLLGCNEESGMGDVGYYNAHNESPLFCFSPDAGFPVCNGEKGHFGGSFVSPQLSGGKLVEFSAGLAPNVIPGNAACVVLGNAAALKDTDRIKVSDAGSGRVRLQAAGIAGHAASPKGTVNAIGLLVDYLLESDLCSAQEEGFLQLLQRLHSSAFGQGLGIACKDDIFNALTINGGVISLEDGVLRQSIDIRFPTATTGEALATALEKAAVEHGAAFQLTSSNEPFFIPADSPAIQALLQAHNTVTGLDGQPFTMGGGTYARHFKNAVSFGPFPVDGKLASFAGPEHGANEGAELESLLTALKIYILALHKLQQIDF